MRFGILILLSSLTISGSVQLASGDGPPKRHSSGGYRLIGEPVAETFDGGRGYSIYVRLNRALPRTRNEEGDRRVAAKLLVAGGGSQPSVSVSGRRSRHCYNGDAERIPREAVGLKVGQKVRIALRIDGVRRALRTHALVIRPESNAQRRLGC